MSITKELAEKFKDKPAVLCCRFEAGTVLEPENLEDPAIFDDLVDSGLLSFPDNALTIQQVLGATLKETADSLTPLTEELLDNLPTVEEPVAEDDEKISLPEATQQTMAEKQPGQSAAGYAHIHIGEGKNIDLTIHFDGSGVSFQ